MRSHILKCSLCQGVKPLAHSAPVTFFKSFVVMCYITKILPTTLHHQCGGVWQMGFPPLFATKNTTGKAILRNVKNIQWWSMQKFKRSKNRIMIHQTDGNIKRLFWQSWCESIPRAFPPEVFTTHALPQPVAWEQNALSPYSRTSNDIS